MTFIIRDIVCPVDFSDGSQRAVDHAVALALREKATLHLVHVYRIDILVGPDGGLAISSDAWKEIGDDAKRHLELVAEPARAQGLTVETHAIQGSPAEETIALATKLDADLIVVGTHGRTGLSRLLLGSVAESVVRNSPLPVLTVRLLEPPSDASE